MAVRMYNAKRIKEGASHYFPHTGELYLLRERDGNIEISANGRTFNKWYPSKRGGILRYHREYNIKEIPLEIIMKVYIGELDDFVQL